MEKLTKKEFRKVVKNLADQVGVLEDNHFFKDGEDMTYFKIEMSIAKALKLTVDYIWSDEYAEGHSCWILFLDHPYLEFYPLDSSDPSYSFEYIDGEIVETDTYGTFDLLYQTYSRIYDDFDFSYMEH